MVEVHLVRCKLDTAICAWPALEHAEETCGGCLTAPDPLNFLASVIPVVASIRIGLIAFPRHAPF
jgi:hypothetical protein